MQNIDFGNSSKEKTKIFSIKTQVGKEQNAADLVNSRAEKSKLITGMPRALEAVS